MNGRKLVLEFLIGTAILFLLGEGMVTYLGIGIPTYSVLMLAAALVANFESNEIAKPQNKEYNRKKALYPKIPKDLLFNKPVSNSVIFGRDIYSNKYVMKNPDEIQHSLIVGQSGSGKTANVILSSILSCDTGSKQILDIKSRELMLKSADLSSDKTCVVDLNNMADYAWGWDIFYKLEGLTETEALEYAAMNVFLEVASIVIPDAKNGDNFWNQAARNLFIGIGVFEYVYKGKHNFVEVVESMLAVPLREHLDEALQTVQKDNLVASLLNAYAATEDETLMSIQITMTQPLYLFLQQDVQYAFKTNPKKATPRLLNQEGTAMYLCVDENKLDGGYDKLLQIVMKQTLSELQNRDSVTDSPIVNLYWDEFGRCCDSCPEMLKATASFLKTARSKRANLTMAVQSVDSFDKVLLYDLLANVTYFIVLNCSNANSLTAEITCKMANKYYEKRVSFNTGKGKNSSISYEEKDVLKPGDLNVLGDEAVLLVSNKGYFRVKKTTQYYIYEPFKSAYEKIYKQNKEILKEV